MAVKWGTRWYKKRPQLGPRSPSLASPNILGSGFGRTDFSGIFIYGPPDFFADFLAGFFLLIFVGKSAQKNPRKNPPKFIPQNPPTHFCRLAGARKEDKLRRKRLRLPDFAFCSKERRTGQPLLSFLKKSLEVKAWKRVRAIWDLLNDTHWAF